MAAGDIIYVKEGPSVVGRGEVQGPYAYALCEEIKDDEGHLWPHQVPVKWDPEFTPIRILVGAEQHSTVCELREEDLRRLGEAESLMQENLRSAEDEEAREEGELVHAYISFRRRNRTLVEAKRAQCASKPCEACGFSFTSRYGGSIGELQEVHHRNPIAEREGVTVTTLEDLVWICPNCHRALHSTRPAMSVDALRQRMRQPEQRNGQRTRTAARVVVVRRPRATIGAQG
jgi:predicted HNH restriction endonuclease